MTYDRVHTLEPDYTVCIYNQFSSNHLRYQDSKETSKGQVVVHYTQFNIHYVNQFNILNMIPKGFIKVPLTQLIMVKIRSLYLQRL